MQKSLSQSLLQFLGVVLIVAGVVGFFNNPLLGTFPVNAWLSLAYLAAGLFAIGYAVTSDSDARAASRVLAVLFALATLAGLVVAPTTLFGLFPVNAASTWLHLILTVAFAIAGASHATYPSHTERLRPTA
jgi:uncharacterized membrane protein HdeD (DUF308 family)